MEDQGLSGPEPVGSVRDVKIPDAAGGEQTLRIYIPQAPGDGALPFIMGIHGGGWVLFDIDTYDCERPAGAWPTKPEPSWYPRTSGGPLRRCSLPRTTTS